MTWKKPTFDWSQWIWHIGALVLFFALSNGFYRLFHDGYRLYQPDIAQYIGMSHESSAHEVLTGESVQWSNAMFSGMPAFQSGAKSDGFSWAYELRSWLLRSTAGAEISILFIAMLSAYLLALAMGASSWWAALVGVGYGFSTIMVLYLGAGHRTKVQAIAFIPGVVAGVLWAYRNQVWKGASVVTLFLSLHLSSNHLQMTYYLLIFLGVLVVFIGVRSWRAGQIRAFLRASSILVVAGALASLPNIMGIMDTKVYSEYTTRGKAVLKLNEDGVIMGSDGTSLSINAASGGNSGDGLGDEYILEYSMSKMEWLAVMCPDFKGGAANAPANIQGQMIDVPVYWGEQKYSAGAFYFGTMVMALFFAFLFVGRHWLRWPFAILTVLSIVLSWREMSFVMEFFLDYVPLFDKFRDTKMMLVLVQLMSGMGAVMMLKELVELGRRRREHPEEWKRQSKRVLMAFGGIFAVFVVFYVFPTMLLDFRPSMRGDLLADYLSPAQLTELRVGVFRADVARTLGLLLVTTGASALLLWGKVKPQFVALAVLALHTVDVWNVNQRYHSNEVVPGQPSSWVSEVDYTYPFKPTPAHLQVLQAEWKDVPTFKETRDLLLEDYQSRFPRRLRAADNEFLQQIAEFDALRLDGEMFRVFHFDKNFSDAESSYFFRSAGGYHGAKLQRYQDFMEVMLADEMKVLAAYARKGEVEAGLEQMWGYRMLNTKYFFFKDDQVIQSVDPFGPAWFVDDISWVKTPNDEIIQTKRLQSKTRAVMPEEMRKDAAFTSAPGAHSIDLEKHAPEHIRYQVNSEHGGMMVCSEVYYPLGWKVYIDGERVPLLRANFLFRAISVPAGSHTVEMRFEPNSSSTVQLANIGNFISLIFFLFASVWSFREDQTAMDL